MRVLRVWASFWVQKSIFFTLFLELEFLIDFEAFWEGFGRVWGGFKEGLWTVWEVLGKGLAGVGEGLGKVQGEFGEGSAWEL